MTAQLTVREWRWQVTDPPASGSFRPSGTVTVTHDVGTDQWAVIVLGMRHFPNLGTGRDAAPPAHSVEHYRWDGDPSGKLPGWLAEIAADCMRDEAVPNGPTVIGMPQGPTTITDAARTIGCEP